MIVGKEIIPYNDVLYMVEKRYKEATVKENMTNELKEFLGCDLVLRKNGYLFFCTIIKEAEIINDENTK